MKRVVITGMGIVSSIGNSTQEVTASLREAKSGISYAADHEKLGFRCREARRELRRGACANNGGGDMLLSQHPPKRDLERGDAKAVGGGGDGVDDHAGPVRQIRFDKPSKVVRRRP